MPANPKPLQESEPTVLVIDDDAGMQAALRTLLRSVGLRVSTFSSTDEFLAGPLPDAPSCLVLDVRLPGGSGLDFQTRLANSSIQTPIVFITGHGDIPMTVQAMKAGAVEFLPKPFRDQDLLDAVSSALEKDEIRRRSRNLTAEVRTQYELLTAREQQVVALVTRGLMNK